MMCYILFKRCPICQIVAIMSLNVQVKDALLVMTDLGQSVRGHLKGHMAKLGSQGSDAVFHFIHW